MVTRSGLLQRQTFLRLCALARRSSEDRPEFPVERVQFRVSRNNCTTVRPIGFILHQLSSYRISQDIGTRLTKSVSLALLRPKHMVVWLMLPLTLVAQGGLKMYAEELHCAKLVTLVA